MAPRSPCKIQCSAQFGNSDLHIHDLGNTLRGKGIDFAEQCKVFEVCNPLQAGRVLSTDMSMNMYMGSTAPYMLPP